MTGKYFEGNAVRTSSKESYDARKAKELWGGSAELVKLEVEELSVAMKLG